MVYLQFAGLIIFLALYIWFFSFHRENQKILLVQKSLEAGAFVLDVRSHEEYKQGHFSRAININMKNLYLKKEKLPTDLNQHIVVYSRSLGSANKAIKILRTLGYKNIVNGLSLSVMKRFEANKEV